jgi:hypothetical protein
MTSHSKTLPSLSRAAAIGAVGFSVASLCVFATVAFGERWLYTHVGVAGAYVLWISLFILLGGAMLGSLVIGRWRLPKFYLLYGIAFFAYAVGWVGAYFTLRGTAGEWVGSIAGSVLMALVFAVGFGAIRSTMKFAVILFVTNSLGYLRALRLTITLVAKAACCCGGLHTGCVWERGLAQCFIWRKQ